MTIESVIDAAWDARGSIGADTKGEVRQAVDTALASLDSGEARIAEKVDGDWRVNQWLKKAVLLSFRLNPMEAISGEFGRHLVPPMRTTRPAGDRFHRIETE